MTQNTPDHLTLTLAQLNPIVGDITGNGAKALEVFKKARDARSDLIIFPELFITGYPPEDLILKPSFQTAAMDEIKRLAKQTANSQTALLIGTPWLEGGKLYNAAALLLDGNVAQVRFKRNLPNYSVFDEKRVFARGPLPDPIDVKGLKIGAPICEDIWGDGEICAHLARQGAELLVVPNGSPFTVHKRQQRLEVIKQRISETGLSLLYVNQVGGQDELVFDGASLVMNADHSIAAQLKGFENEITHSRWQPSPKGWRCHNDSDTRRSEPASLDETTYSALVLGLRDYVEKNRFPGVVLGLSGGIDSAICAAIAVDALGPERVHCIMLPYQYTSKESLTDAKACAKALKVRYDVIPIKQPVEGFLNALSPLFEGLEEGVTEENLQSRTRGVLLMAVSNKLGAMLVTTGNKSEMSVGYATIYGDMNGGFNPIKDLYKMRVYELSQWRNNNLPTIALGPDGTVIPENIITKAPSAELRDNQTDQDSLPPYPDLDDILECLVEREMSIPDIIARGYEPAIVRKIEHLLAIAEYKRRQAAPGVKITSRNFGRDRRYPITNGFRDPE